MTLGFALSQSSGTCFPFVTFFSFPNTLIIQPSFKESVRYEKKKQLCRRIFCRFWGGDIGCTDLPGTVYLDRSGGGVGVSGPFAGSLLNFMWEESLCKS